MITFFFFTIIAVLIGLYVTRNKKENSKSWIKFFSKGKEAGFSIRDMEQLRHLVTNCKIQDPLSIFTSQKQFQMIIRSMVNSARSTGEINDPPIQNFLSKLFDHCKKLEMDTNENKVRISSSRQISEGQALRVLVPGTGVYKSEVVKNFSNYLTITRPVNPSQGVSMQWYNLKISVYFWREDDAGYVFDTEVIDEVFSKGISSLKIDHNDSLFRTQKRKSMRVKYQKLAFLYMVKEGDSPHRLERSAGLRCMLDDISDSGCAFKVNGQATIGLRLKVQFSLDKVPICIPGTVRSVDYNQEANISLIHMEADPLPVGTRNHILCEVFNLLPEEDEDELPFRTLDEEAKETAPENGNNSANKIEEAMNA
ncbi:MAG: PilZ domain-containing protein [Spirochaetes bacterium]|nr:PilZ domain-containing protein [Spirochaetota bacterium]